MTELSLLQYASISTNLNHLIAAIRTLRDEGKLYAPQYSQLGVIEQLTQAIIVDFGIICNRSKTESTVYGIKGALRALACRGGELSQDEVNRAILTSLVDMTFVRCEDNVRQWESIIIEKILNRVTKLELKTDYFIIRIIRDIINFPKFARLQIRKYIKNRTQKL